MSFQHILVPIDGSSTSYAAISKATDLAKAFNSKVTVVCVLSLDPFFGVEFINTQDMLEGAIQQAHEEVDKVLNAAKAKFDEQGITVDTQIIEGSEIDKAIVQASEDIKADLIVIGSHGRKGFKKFVLGSVAQSILGEVSVPVLVVRE